MQNTDLQNYVDSQTRWVSHYSLGK